MKRDETLFCAISDKVMHKAVFGGEREVGGGWWRRRSTVLPCGSAETGWSHI